MRCLWELIPVCLSLNIFRNVSVISMPLKTLPLPYLWLPTICKNSIVAMWQCKARTKLVNVLSELLYVNGWFNVKHEDNAAKIILASDLTAIMQNWASDTWRWVRPYVQTLRTLRTRPNVCAPTTKTTACSKRALDWMSGTLQALRIPPASYVCIHI
jgi:hypothetical protein